ncbi:MAG: leucine-rich repeat domain-containing protein [Sodaliphilus sp.]
MAILIANCISASAIEFTVDGVRYSVNNDSTTVTVAGYPSGSKPTGDLTIPESVTYGGISFSVTSIGYEAFYDCSGLTSVTIPNSVTKIGDQAFYCTAWYNNQPDGLVYAGPVAYKYKGTMPSGTSIVLKEGTKGIADWAFSYCSGLTSVTIPNSVISIGDYAFYSCSGLTSVTIPNSVTEIGEGAFSGCNGLTSVTIPNSVTSIDGFAFSGCIGLMSLTIPNSVTSIDDGAFFCCYGLTSVTIPNSVTYIGEGAFYDCSGLTRIDAYPNPEKVTMGTDAFLGVPKDGTLHVLPKYLSAYRTASQWKDFPNIKGDLTEIGDIEVVHR